MSVHASIHLLLIEDNPGDARLVREHLADAASGQVFRLDHAATLAEAKSLVESGVSRDIVLLDLSLPDSFGLETLARWQVIAPKLPVIVLTGSDDEALAVAAVREGAQDYLVKGRIDGAVLVQAIRYAIERKLVQEDLREAKNGLERRVEERTAELLTTNAQLQSEIAERTLAQQRAAELLQREQVARAEVENVNRSKDEFLAILSHELRTPLNAILGWSEILRSGDASAEEVQEGFQVIDRNARAQARLVEDVLEVSRIICGKVRLSIAPVDLTMVVEAALASARPAAAAKNIRLNQDIHDVPPEVPGDAVRLQQVIWNLLSNAIKFTPKHGEVTVRAARTGDRLVIEVADTGIGIKTDFLPFVFDRFRQSDGSITRSHGGLGLGLSISRHLVEMHGGTISATSNGEGQGSVFTAALPLSFPFKAVEPTETLPAAPQMSVSPPGQENSSLEGISVLVVDDEPDSRRVVVRQLLRAQATVREAESVSQADATLQSWVPDVLISDIAMPGEDGYSLVKRLRSSVQPALRQLPAVALTAFARLEDQTRALEAGFQKHLPKPFDPHALISAIKELAKTQSRQHPVDLQT